MGPLLKCTSILISIVFQRTRMTRDSTRIYLKWNRDIKVGSI